MNMASLMKSMTTCADFPRNIGFTERISANAKHQTTATAGTAGTAGHLHLLVWCLF